MSGVSFQRVKEVYLSVAELPREEQPAALERACGGDAGLRGKVERMLSADHTRSDFMAGPALLSGEEELARVLDAAGLSAPERVGPYRVMELLGEGGFGSVYRAEQESPIRREVALKIIKPGMGTRGVIARFEAERQTLAVLDHPGIARVFDAGATGAGQPYFVMELIRGVPVTEYCDRERLTIGERLRIFVGICRAVQHAHQKGVIHRDLKPSNVLAETIGGEAVVKVIDFGIAKAIDAPAGGETLVTRAGQMVGTPDAMSPEQADPSLGDIDTRTDIYALGALLYELLTGMTPLGIAASRRASLAEIVRVICREEPARPSVRLAAMGPELSEIAGRRGTDARRLIASVRGDLDWISMKALEKDRSRRYETAQGLAADVLRHLRDEPVDAGPPSAAYLAKKFVRRHRLGVAAAGVVMLAVGAGVAGIGVALARALDAETASRAAREETEAVNDFLIEDLLGAAHTERQGPSVTVVEAMEGGLGRVDERFRGQPATAARIRAMMGTVYDALGMFDRAAPALEDAWREQRRLLGANAADTLETQRALAAALVRSGRAGEAEPILRDAVERCVASLGADHSLTLQTETLLGEVLQQLGEHDEAGELLRRSIGRMRAVMAADDLPLLGALTSLNASLSAQGLDAEAEPICREVLELSLARYPEGHPAVLSALNNMASLLMRLDKAAEAEPLSEELLRQVQAALPAGHWQIAWSRFGYGVCLVRLGELEAARPVLELAYEEARGAMGRDHHLTERALGELVNTLDALGDPAVLEYNRLSVETRLRVANSEQRESVALAMREFMERAARHGPDTHPPSSLVANLGETARGMLEESDPAASAYLANLGWALLETGFLQEAERWLLAGHETLSRARGTDVGARADVAHLLATLYERVGRAEEAALWRGETGG